MVWALLFSIVFSPHVSARSIPRIEKRICPGLTFSSRSDSLNCPRALRLGEEGTFCFSHSLWLKILTFSSSCFLVQGYERLYSPPLLKPGKKEILLRTQVEHVIPDSKGNDFTLNFVRKIERIREKLGILLPEGEGGDLFKLLLLSERSGKETLVHLRWMGFVHVLTATGIHLYAFLNAMERIPWLLARFGILLPVPVLFLFRAFAYLLCVLLWALTGFRAGMLRPFCIVALRGGAKRLGIRWKPFFPLLIAMIGEALFGHSAWEGRVFYALSVGGGVIALEGLKERKESPSVFQEHFALALGSFWLAAIWECFHSGLLSPWTPILSLLSIPLLVSFAYPIACVAVGLGLLGWPEQSRIFFQMLASGLEITLFPFAGFLMKGASLLWIPTWALGFSLGLALLIAAFRLRTVGVVVLLILSVAIRSMPLKKAESSSPLAADQIEQWDVGQGDAALVAYTNMYTGEQEAGFIDVGPEHALSPDLWIKSLASRGILKLSFVALTHLDEDHVGGIHRLMKLIPIDAVYTSRAEWESSRGQRLKEELENVSISTFSWEEGEFPFLARSLYDGLPSKGKSGNDRMSAVLIPLNNDSLYANPGDADGVQERRAMEWFQEEQKKRHLRLILKAAHHGSKYSSSSEALNGIQAEEVWISSGVGNLYKHPTKEALGELSKITDHIHRTDQEGLIRLDLQQSLKPTPIENYIRQAIQ